MPSFVVLVVDSDRDARQAAVGTLEAEGYRVLAARSGGEAMALIDRHPGIDLMVTEVVMAGIGGFMLADMARVRRPEMRIVYTSGFDEIATLKTGRLVGAFVPKPADAAVMRDIVGQALRGATETPALPDRRTLPRPARRLRTPALGV